MARYRDIIGVAVDQAGLVFTLLGIARLADAWGDLVAAARLLGAMMGHPVYRWHSDVPDAAKAREVVADLRTKFCEDAFAAAWNDGESMSFDAAVAYALTLEPPATPPRQAPVLTLQEQEVARLIAAGKSNREITAALVIVGPTAERHVANILTKLDFHARTELRPGGRARGFV